MEIEISKHLGIGEVPGARAEISHTIGRARNVIMSRNVAVKSLVMSLEAQKVRRGAGCRGGALSEPINVGLVIGSGPNGSFANVGTLGDDIVMGDITAEFKVAVVDRAVGVVEGNDVVLNSGGERLAPQERLRGVVVDVVGVVAGAGAGAGQEEHASHAGCGGVAGANHVRDASRDEFRYSGGP